MVIFNTKLKNNIYFLSNNFYYNNENKTLFLLNPNNNFNIITLGFDYVISKRIFFPDESFDNNFSMVHINNNVFLLYNVFKIYMLNIKDIKTTSFSYELEHIYSKNNIKMILKLDDNKNIVIISKYSIKIFDIINKKIYFKSELNKFLIKNECIIQLFKHKNCLIIITNLGNIYINDNIILSNETLLPNSIIKSSNYYNNIYYKTVNNNLFSNLDTDYLSSYYRKHSFNIFTNLNIINKNNYDNYKDSCLLKVGKNKYFVNLINNNYIEILYFKDKYEAINIININIIYDNYKLSNNNKYIYCYSSNIIYIYNIELFFN